MSYAQIELEFYKYANPGVEYLLRTVVDATYSKPDPVDACLVIKKGDSTAAEELLRVATYAELITSPLDALPADVELFSSASLAYMESIILVGDVVRITSPEIWTQFFYAGVQEDFTVTTVNSSTEVVVTPTLPAFGRELTFEVWRGSSKVFPVTAALWVAATAYVQGDTALSTGGDTYWCQVAGTSAGVEPTWDTTLGNTTTDGTVTWLRIDNGVTPTDGVANRDYTAFPAVTLFLAATHADSWEDLYVAENRLIALKAEASSLVDALNEEDWSGTEEVTYP